MTDEHARLDECGNRAVLTEPVTGVSIPVLFAATRGTRAGGGGAELRRPLHDVPGTR